MHYDNPTAKRQYQFKFFLDQKLRIKKFNCHILFCQSKYSTQVFSNTINLHLFVKQYYFLIVVNKEELLKGAIHRDLK